MNSEDLNHLYSSCELCPRRCRVNRLEGELGFCGQAGEIRLAWAGLHRGEEPPVSGRHGSGALFFSGCTLGCVFCQNRQLSRENLGRTVSQENLADIFLKLQEAGAANLNFVTGTPFIPGILRALALAEARGLNLPVVWNSSGYENRAALELLYPAVDLWLPDLKTLDPELSRRFFAAGDYPEAAQAALAAMRDSPAGGVLWGEGDEPAGPDEQTALRMIVRHLVLPGSLESSRRVLEYFAGFRTGGIVLSLMTQYIPMPGDLPEGLDRPLPAREAEEVYRVLEEQGIDEGFIQGPPDDEANKDSLEEWMPDFRRTDPFPAGWARTIWSWRTCET